ASPLGEGEARAWLRTTPRPRGLPHRPAGPGRLLLRGHAPLRHHRLHRDGSAHGADVRPARPRHPLRAHRPRADAGRHEQHARRQLLRVRVTAQEEARRRISRELHDQMGQYLSTLMLRLKTLRPLAAGQESARINLQKLEELTGRLVDEVHHLAWELRPAALDDLGLHTALQNYSEKWSERSGVAVDFHCGGLERQRLSPEVETTIYRVVQEALTNVLKHAEARLVSVIVERRRDHV